MEKLTDGDRMNALTQAMRVAPQRKRTMSAGTSLLEAIWREVKAPINSKERVERGSELMRRPEA